MKHAPFGEGRASNGRFVPGYKGGPGNPHAAQVSKLRSAMLRAVSEEDIQGIVQKLVELARDGNVRAAQEVLSRCLGRPEAIDLIERLEALEDLVGGQKA